MNTAIIAEYNPFHNGHMLNIKMARKMTACDNIIVIMSGDFVQRGEPAIFNKAVRTRQALENGADMVIELPVQYASSAADIFAGAAIEILDKSNIVSSLFFGSEEGDIKRFENAADIFAAESEQFKSLLSNGLSLGLSYPAARQSAAEALLGHSLSFINNPNNILAMEYIIALKRRKSNIRPFTMKREANAYSQTRLSGSISSAAAIRQAVFNGDIPALAIPENTLDDYKNAVFPRLDDYSDIFAYLLRTLDIDTLSHTADMTEGLENRFLKYSGLKTISQIINAVKTKRYTHTKLQRAVLHTILGITKDMQLAAPAYIRVLGIRADKRQLLADLSAKAALPVITNVKEDKNLLSHEIKAADIYRIFTDKAIGSEYSNGLIISHKGTSKNQGETKCSK